MSTDTALAREINEDHPVLAAILRVRHRNAGNFAPSHSGPLGEARDQTLMEIYEEVKTALRSTAAGSVDEARALVQWIIDNSGAHPANISAVAQKAIAALSQVSGRDAVVEECARVVDNLIGELASEAWDEACEVAAAAIRALASTKAGTEGMVPAALLREFRDHVSRHVAVWSNGGGSHHHPIWAKVADALEQAAPHAPAQGEE